MGPELSVVVATYDRPVLLRRLLAQLTCQTLDPDRFEVVVVDDGSTPPASEKLADLRPPYELRIERQPNRGAAAARHRGALEAHGEVLVIVDDDMQVGPGFLECHLRRHEEASRKVVLGRIERDPEVAMPLFERWHARKIDELGERFLHGESPTGLALYTGNVSLRRDDYLAVGGFDVSLGNSEDVELGLRLQKYGAAFEFAPEARTLHGSDHDSLQRWRARAARYGSYALRIARKHPDVVEANPWRFLFELNPLARPLLAAAALAPGAASPLAAAAYRVGAGLDRLKLERAALAGANLAFGIDYFRGLRAEAGRLPQALSSLGRYCVARALAHGRRALLLRLASEVQADQATLRRYEEKYGHPQPSRGSLPADLVQKIGLQELAAYRLMRALRDAGLPLAAKVVSRSMRHLYGSDIHWDAELAPGVMLVHGMGLAVSHGARVGAGCILFQNVTLGMGTDSTSRAYGAPVLEDDVHVGPGACIVGPVRVGAGSKVMAGAVLDHSVPPRSIVAPAAAEVRRRSPEGNAPVPHLVGLN